ncbi:cytochrome P450 [Frondihabitans australicus]|uniref:Cytochrome P450 n=1 Tax=Frondihabitans australicus TaxID=386892 RepID=A0A495IDB6_9MICO|nr:cytochrome P450 [Frondihabitans australicus]RKR73458.1 cytochrome P450 [Frondihabitans australicus]
MQAFATRHEVDTDVDISSVAFWSQTFDERDRAFARLRADAPVSWHEPLETPGYPKAMHGEEGFWALTTVADIRAVSRAPEQFSSAVGQVALRPAPFRIQRNMLVMDPPDHEVYRRIVSKAFTTRSVAALTRRIERRAKQVVARAALADEFDFVPAISAQLPLRTIADLLGLPETVHDEFVVAADAYVGAAFPGVLAPGDTFEAFHDRQVAWLRDLVVAFAAFRRREPGDDLMTALVSARVDGRPLGDDAILSTVLLLIVAGDDTTKQATTLAVLALHEQPEQLAWLVGDFESRIEAALDELLRWASPVLTFARTATVDTVIGGRSIAAGDKVGLFYCSGNRDARVFDEPQTLRLDRPRAQHVAFGGGGVHFCLGSAVARAELTAVLREVVRRMPRITLGEPVFRGGEFVHAVESLPARVR